MQVSTYTYTFEVYCILGIAKYPHTYTQVGQALAERDAPTGIASKIKRGLKKLVGAKVPPTGVRNKIKHVLGPVDELHNLYGALRKARTARGAIDFETTETRIEFDQNRKIDQIVPVVRNDAHKLIEECMLAANVCAARFLEVHNLPALYRVHEGPGEEKLERLYEFLKEVGLSLSTRVRSTLKLPPSARSMSG